MYKDGIAVFCYDLKQSKHVHVIFFRNTIIKKPLNGNSGGGAKGQ